MSVWKIGAEDVSEETQQFKDKLASKDGEIAGQQTKLIKQALELEELKANLTEALQRLVTESERTLRLQNDLTQCNNDLRNERITCHNLEASLQTTNSKLKAKDKETNSLEAALEDLSSTSNDHHVRGRKLEEEKAILEGRVRQLESKVRQLHSANAMASRRRSSRSSSSAHSDPTIRAMEKDLGDLHDQLTGKESEIQGLQEKLTQAQDDLLRVDNERLAQEARNRSRIDDLQSLLKEEQEELEYYKEQDGDGGREAELLQRIEEDDAKIAALETLLRQSDSNKNSKQQLQNLEQRLRAETEKVVNLRARNTDLEREREGALNELQCYRIRVQEKEHLLQEKQAQLDKMVKDPTGLISADDHRQKRSLENIDMTTVGEVDVLHVAKLLSAIERLREERDGLRRNLQFLETEHKFTIEALEKRLISGALPLGHDQAKPSGARSLVCIVPALAVLVSRLQTQVDQCQSQLSKNIEREQHHSRRAQADFERCSALQEEVNHITYQLKDSEERNEALEARLATVGDLHGDLESQLEEKKEGMMSSQKILQDRLDEVYANLKGVSRTLEVVESERDSFALQVANLTADLEAAQSELISAEGRYSTLQVQQLSSMSSSEATHALRDQIAELEGRVMRRNEQIGIHQHDISRLETNLKLQEERLGEMTLELETLATQKEAMLEDCADAREARDDALSRIESLEEEAELLESKLAGSDQALKTLICVLVETRKLSSAHQLRLRVATLEDQLKNSQERCTVLGTDFIQVRLSTTQDMRQVTTALAISQLQLKKVSSLTRHLITEKTGLIRDLALANEQISEEHATNRRLEDECSTLRHGSSSSVAELAARSSEYQAEIDKLKRTVSEVTTESDLIQKQLVDSSARLERLQQEKEARSAEYEEARSHLALLHDAEVESLRKELLAAVATLEAERADWVVSGQEHQEALSRARSQINELNMQMGALNDEVLRLSATCQDLETKRDDAEKGSDSRRAELDALVQERQNLKKAQENMEDTNRHLLEEISRLQEEQESLVKNHAAHTSEHQKKLESLNLRLESQVTELTGLVEDKAQETQHLTRELDMIARCSREKEQSHAAEMQAISVENEAAQSRLSALEQEVERLRREIEGNKASLTGSEEEKERLQECITGLEAQIQKSLSYTNALERQIRDGGSALETLKTKLSNTQAELSRAETTAKTSEVNLSLQSAQFRRELAKLQDKLAALESRRNLEDVLADLEERNNEMEELLRAKCIEIEENDDRALEMLKENKKLSSKVESLTRKVQNLQTKLAAAKATAASSKAPTEVSPIAANLPKPNPHHPPSQAPEMPEMQPQSNRRRSSRLSTGTTASASASASASKPPSTTTPKAPKPQNTSRPLSTTLRPKTPERRLAPVFKHRTPEQARVQERTTEPPSSVIGVKRRAPDDFEPSETVPPQGFTVESLPSRENESATPRVRRMLGNLQSGFTPVRNKVLPSPKRQTTVLSTPLIQDVTNSPRNSVPLDSAAKQKRSWLGKIRSTSTQATVKPVSRQVFTYVGETQRL